MGKKKGVMSRQPPKDFVKMKNKVGKKKKEAQNNTPTDFKVKQVHMPVQSALEEKGEEVTHRRLGLLELLAHMQHHSARVRRDALRGLQELCAAHEGVLGKNLARIVEATTTAAIDSSAEVRSALSHVNSEVRGDGLQLLELYLARLGEVQVLGQVEALRVSKILCQMQTHSENVLSCLYRLLQPRAPASAAEPAAAGAGGEVQLPLQALLDGRLQQLGGGEAPRPGEEEADADSPVWAFCLRMWMQAGDMPQGLADGSGRSASEAAAKPAWAKLRCAAVLERALQAALAGGSHGMALQPSVAQVATLAGIVRRGEWPLRVDGASAFRQLADSANLCMARVCALLLAGGAPPDSNKYNLNLLANAVLALIEEAASVPWVSSTSVPAAAAAAAAAATAATAGGPGGEVRPLGGAAAATSALRTLDLLWSCSPEAMADGPGAPRATPGPTLALGPQEMDRLVAATARFLEGGSGGEAGGEAEAACAQAVISAPLAASLLGLRPSSAAAAARPPPALRAAWPEALAGVGEPCLAGAVEASQPGTAVAWVTTWPKLLWYLGKSHPELSAFILAMLLELAKQASRPGSLHAQLFTQVCPLLVPFLAGRPGSSPAAAEPPPLALLPAGAAGPQGLAAMLLRHFPRLTEPLLALLAKLVCRWSDVGTAGDGGAGEELAPARLSTECCELVLEAALRGPCVDAEELRAARLRVALTVLTAGAPSAPLSHARAERAERAALQLADAVAGWLMDETGGSCGGCAAELGYDDRRRLAFQSLAWPLCLQVLAASPSLALRALGFLFFCAARLPRRDLHQGGTALSAADLGWRSFLCELFSELVLHHGGRALRPSGASSDAALTSPLCEPTRAGGLPRAGGNSLEPVRFLARLFVTIWMCGVDASHRIAAYELLAKLCAQQLVALEQGPAAEEEEGAVASACAMVLAEAVAYRNEHSLPTGAWGSLGPDAIKDGALAACTAEALRARLRGALPAPAVRRPCLAPGLAALEAMLPLL